MYLLKIIFIFILKKRVTYLQVIMLHMKYQIHFKDFYIRNMLSVNIDSK